MASSDSCKPCGHQYGLEDCAQRSDLTFFLSVSDFDSKHGIHRMIRVIRWAILIAIGLLIASGSLADQPEYVTINKALNEAAYLFFASVVGTLIAVFLVFWHMNSIDPAKIVVRPQI